MEGKNEQYQWAVYHEDESGRQRWFDEYPSRSLAEMVMSGMLEHPEYYGKVTLVEVITNWEGRLLE